MSDPAKTPEEIEDVLASVRRLVSDHTPNRTGDALLVDPPRAAAADPAPAAASEQPEALVLTPSFRVTDPEDPWVPVTTPQAEDADSAEPAEPVAEDLIAEIVTADAEPAAEEPAEASDDAEWQPDDRLVHFDAVGAVEEGADAPQEWVDDHSDEASDEDIADLVRLDGAAETPVAEFESETGDDNWPESGAEAALLTLVARRDPAPEEMPEDAHEAVDEEDFTAEDEEPQAEDYDETVAEDDAGDEQAEAEPDQVEDDYTAEEHTAEVDAAADEHTDGESDDTDPSDADLAEAPVVEEASVEEEAPVEDTAPIEAETPVEDLGDTQSPFSFPEQDEGILDEDTLREIIVDVVREELQGVLGQRITRNVRKMVRREIRLALAAEDLE